MTKTKPKKLSEIDELKKRIDMLEAKILLMEAQRQYPQIVPFPVPQPYPIYPSYPIYPRPWQPYYMEITANDKT